MPDNELNPVVGIDLGTTFSCISRWTGDRAEIYKLSDGSQTLPSIVHMQENDTPLVGRFARSRLLLEPKNTVENIKRHIGENDKVVTLREKEYTPVDISAMILNRLKEDVHKRFPVNAGFEIAGAIVTHPHYFTYPQIAQTKEAAEAAELPVIRLLSDPVAAALNYGFQTYHGLEEEREEKILIFDLGGGTFDVTVIQVTNTLKELVFKVLSVGGDAMLGGTNFDEAFSNWAVTEASIGFNAVEEHARIRAKPILSEAVIEAKIQLSAMDDTILVAANIIHDQHVDLEVSREQFEEIIKPDCSRVRGIVSATLAAAGLRRGELDKTIMIGGSSRIPIMRQIVEDETGAQPWANADVDLAVAHGAAFLAAYEDGRFEDINKEIIVEEATSHALGVREADDVFFAIIPAGSRVPVDASRKFATNDGNLVVDLFQRSCESDAKVTDDSVTALKPLTISGIPLDSNGTVDVKVTFSVDEQQILRSKIEGPGILEESQLDY